MSLLQYITRTIFLPGTINTQAMDNFIQCEPDSSTAVQWRDGQLSELGIVNMTVSVNISHLYKYSVWKITHMDRLHT